MLKNHHSGALNSLKCVHFGSLQWEGILWSTSYLGEWKYLRLQGGCHFPQVLHLHFFFLQLQWNASVIPRENVKQPKKKSDCLVHNVYIVQCHLRPTQQKSVHLDLMHVQASSRRGNKFSVLREPPQRMLGVDDLGKAEICGKNKHHCFGHLWA